MCLNVGTKIEQCPSCGLLFSSTVAGDAHRVGDHGATEGSARRRCLSVDEMKAKLIEKGAMAGEPWFAARIDKAGCEVWGRSAENRSWEPALRRGECLAALPRTQSAGKHSRASEQRRTEAEKVAA